MRKYNFHRMNTNILQTLVTAMQRRLAALPQRLRPFTTEFDELPKNLIARVGLKNLRLYATGNNLLTWTKYSGFDPEVSTMKSGLTPGVDFGAYPLSRSFIFGLNVAF